MKSHLTREAQEALSSLGRACESISNNSSSSELLISSCRHFAASEPHMNNTEHLLRSMLQAATRVDEQLTESVDNVTKLDEVKMQLQQTNEECAGLYAITDSPRSVEG